MAQSVAELKDALKDAMERNGGLRKLQAHARAEAYRALGAAEVCRGATPLQQALRAAGCCRLLPGGSAARRASTPKLQHPWHKHSLSQHAPPSGRAPPRAEQRDADHK